MKDPILSSFLTLLLCSELSKLDSNIGSIEAVYYKIIFEYIHARETRTGSEMMDKSVGSVFVWRMNITQHSIMDANPVYPASLSFNNGGAIFPLS